MDLPELIGTDDPTVEEMEASGRRLGIICHDCARFRYMNSRRFAAGRKISDIAGERHCGRCHSGNIKIAAISKDPDTGFWPAERS